MNVVPVPTFASVVPTCIAMGAGAQPLIDLTNYNNNYTYVWSPSNGGWQYTSTLQGDLTITGILNNDPCTWTLTLTPINANVGCGVLTYSYVMNRSFLLGLFNPGPICVSPGANVFTINTPTNGQAIQSCWGTIPTGWTWTPVGISGRTFTVPNSAAGSTNTIQLWSCACPSPVLTVTIRVRPATPGPISGPACVNLGTAYNYSVPQAGTFTWTKPVNWLGASTTNTISLTPVVNAGTVSVELNGQPGCPSVAATRVVNLFPVVTQPACLNSGAPTTGAVYSTGVAGTVWSFPPGLTLSVPPAGPTATINVIGTANTMWPCFATVNGCTTPFTVVIPALTVTLNVNEADPNFTQITALPQLGNTSYFLFNCSTQTVVQGPQSGNQFTIGGPMQPGSYTIIVDPNGPGCVQSPPCQNTEFNGMVLGGNDPTKQPQAVEKSLTTTETQGVIVRPNPNTGTFVVAIDQDFRMGMATLYDAKGQQVGTPSKLNRGDNAMGSLDLASGTYVLLLELDGRTLRQPVVITKQ